MGSKMWFSSGDHKNMINDLIYLLSNILTIYFKWVVSNIIKPKTN